MSLCNDCRNVLHFTRRNGEARYYCRSIRTGILPIPGDIERCSDYEKTNTTSKYDMEQIAWTLRTDKSGRVVGFTPPEKKP